MGGRFLDEGFLLGSRAAKRLYHEHAQQMPIFDFHCHLPPKDIAENRRFGSITEAWLGGDHYKWRAMRTCGVPERLITGDASDQEKFLAWAEVVPSTVGNPLYLWTHLELKRYFGVSGKLLGPRTAREIYDDCSALLSREDFRVRGLLERMGVRMVCTTDDPVDSLEHHARLRGDESFGVTVVPAFRPDRAMAVEDPAAFNSWVDRLAVSAGIEIPDWQRLIDALRRRHDYFHQSGCRISDHGIEVPYAEDFTEAEARAIFLAARAGRAPSPSEVLVFKSAILVELARMDAEKKWVQQLHIGALRNINTRFSKALGPDSGFDTIGDAPFARSLARLMDRLDAEGILPKTILYCLNPADNAVLACMTGNYPQESVRAKMQFGSAWWFNDQPHGMEEQMKVLADMGLLARFVGMVTDSRSFLSYPRHECFRRILCDMLGGAVERGEAPEDYDLLGGIVRDICWNNAVQYFEIPMKGSGKAHEAR
jgi:glucuronate isomerase